MTRVVVSDRLHVDSSGRTVDPLKALPHITAEVRLAWAPGADLDAVEAHARAALESVLRQARRARG